MDLDKVKELVGANCVFETVDETGGTVQVPTGNFHDVEFGGMGFFEEGGSPAPAPITTKTEQFESHPFRLRGKSESEIAKAYLGVFYFWILKNQQANRPAIPANSIKAAAEIENLFSELPSQYTSDVCLVATSGEFSNSLGVLYNSPALGIAFRAGTKMHSRDLLSWGEPLVLMPGPKKGRIVVAERSAIVLNVPQKLEATGNDWYKTNLEFKVIQAQHMAVYPV